MMRNLYITLLPVCKWGYRQTRRYPLISTYKWTSILNFYLLLLDFTRYTSASLLGTGVVVHD